MMELFHSGLVLSSVVQNHQQQDFLLPELLTPASVLHPAALSFSWALLFSNQCLEIELIQCKTALLYHTFLFLFLSWILDY